MAGCGRLGPTSEKRPGTKSRETELWRRGSDHQYAGAPYAMFRLHDLRQGRPSGLGDHVIDPKPLKAAIASPAAKPGALGYAAARLGSIANGLSPSQAWILAAMSWSPVSTTFAPSFLTVVKPIQIEVIVRRSVET